VAGADVLVWLGLRERELAIVLTDGKLVELAAGPEVTLDTPDAEAQVIAFIDAHVSPKVLPVLAGTTIQRDRAIVRGALPALDRRVHYRMVDVLTIGELARRWYPEVVAQRAAPPAPGRARAIDAVRESIEELRFYRQHVFSAAV
jgi:oligoribonuclease